MNKNVIVFIPDNLEYHKVGYISGYKETSAGAIAYYVFTGKVTKSCPNHCIGFISSGIPEVEISGNEKFELLINAADKSISINGAHDRYKGITEVVYSSKVFQNIDIEGDTGNFGKHFTALVQYIKKDKHCFVRQNGNKSAVDCFLYLLITLLVVFIKIFGKISNIVAYSSTFTHFEENCNLLKLFLEDFYHNKKFSPKLGNILVTRLIDTFVGITVVSWFLRNEAEILNFIQNSTEELIANLKRLLLYLMGSPIGLKLNYAFNKSLGQFFFYHISLWRIFLQGLQPLLIAHFRLLVLPGALGISFQVAMISDLISVTTFHVYCIYVYGARIFNIQLRGLTSLWRLFLGRKYNPLRQRVDSCQYSQNQLFIGTLGFTILLFLLPTTAMYYTVFSILRLTTVCINKTLQKIRCHLNTLPVYIFILWIFNSSSLSGHLILKHKGTDGNGILKIEAHLTKYSLVETIRKFIPDSGSVAKSDSLKIILHSMVTGPTVS